MRPSQRNRILDAAIRVTERGGITALTLESAAEEAGITKGGLMYHFPTRAALLDAIHAHLMAGWEQRLAARLGKAPEQATGPELTEAYVRVGTEGRASRADLAFMLDSSGDPRLLAAWEEMITRWAPLPTSADPRDVDLLLARMAVDGIWLWQALAGFPLPEPLATALHERLESLVDTR